MNAKHTPGPWNVFSERSNEALGAPKESEIRSNNRTVIVRLGVVREWQKADVALIAAAPDLLAALQRCVAVMEQRCLEASPLPDARAAIAKATGSGNA